MKIAGDWLLDILLKCRRRPALLTGVQSLRVLENFINGYIEACRQMDSNCLTLQWYDEFTRFLVDEFSIKDEFFSVTRQIQNLGYTDEDGAVYFLELLDRFVRERTNFLEKKKRVSQLQPGEVRAFRLGRYKESELFAKLIGVNIAEYFGVESTDEGSLTIHYMQDGIVVCALSKGRDFLDNFEEAFSNLPTIEAAERIRFEMLLC